LFYLLYKWFYASDGPQEYLRFFRYLSVRTMAGAGCAFVFALIIGPVMIRFFLDRGIQDRSRDFGNLAQSTKNGTVTMGGVLILASTLLSALFWCDLANRFVQLSIGCAMLFAALGAWDDLLKIRSGSNEGGLSRKTKYLVQTGIGATLAILLLSANTSPLTGTIARSLFVPFFKSGIYIGLLYIIFLMFFLVLSSNSVNLTDGMDGLATVPAIFVALVMGVFAYVSGNHTLASYLQYQHLRGAGELCVLCGIIAGSSAGFLWFNAFPASIIMGDTGSLMLGGLLGTIAVLLKQEILFFIAGGLFVIETGSTFIQDYIGWKLLGRRICFRAPFHHSLLYKGVGETKVTVRLWIISAVFALIALATLKIR